MGGVEYDALVTGNRGGFELSAVRDIDAPRASTAPRRSAPGPADGRVALVTAGSRGLGLQIVRMLAERGMRVVLACRSVDSGRFAIDLLGNLDGRVAVRQLDTTDPASVERLTSWLDQRLGRCDVLVNNAAVPIDDDGDAATVDLDLVRRTLEKNLLGTWRLTQAVAPLMRACRYGRIVNICSGLGTRAPIGRSLAVYRVSTGMVGSLTRVLAEELAEDGVLVNACCPELTDDDAWDSHDSKRLAASADTPVWLAMLPDDGPTGRLYRGRTPVDC
ncbi:MAG TPA: SDR family NAD(P)-dependent oxidoreductase [Micromonosporaceae bacterium]